MPQARILRRAAIWRLDGLPLLLLVSLLIHLSLICFSVPGSAGTGRGDDGDRPALSASVSRAVALAPQARERTLRDSAPAPVREPVAPVSAPAASAEVRADPADPAPAVDQKPARAFYAANELTIRPVALGEPALDAGIAASGEVVLSLWIDDLGSVVEVSVERSDLPAEQLPALADAFRMLRFAPGELNGQTVGAVIRIAVKYDDDQRLPMAP